MLLELKFSNVYSFYKEQHFSMVATSIKDLPQNTINLSDVPSLKGVKALKSAVIYGGNASGKTNFIRTIRDICNLVKNSYLYDPNKLLDKVSFNSTLRIPEPSFYEIGFIAGKKRFVYSLKCTHKKVISESLYAFPNGKKQLWFSREAGNGEGIYIWKFGSNMGAEKKIKDFTPYNVLFLSRASTFNSQNLKEVYDWFARNIYLYTFEEGQSFDSILTDELIIGSEENRKELASFLRKADTGIEDVIVNTQLNNQIEFVHKGIEIHFDKKMESCGTRRMFNFWSVIKIALELGNVIIVDELENSLHPLLLRQLILIFNSERNTNNAQLIITSHNTYLLPKPKVKKCSGDEGGDIFRRDQVWFCEKSDDGTSEMFPLSDFGLRNDLAIEKAYLTGRFGARPNITEDLM